MLLQVLSSILLAGNVQAGVSDNFASFTERIFQQGEEVEMDLFNIELGIPEGSPARSKSVRAESCEDGWSRSVALILDKKRRPDYFLFSTRINTVSSSTTHFFKLTNKGKPSLFLTHAGENKDGRPVKATGEFRKAKLSSKEAKTVIQRELDFWLHGKGLKQPAEQAGK